MSLPGATRVHPGVYLLDGELHIHAPEFLDFFGVPYSTEAENEIANMALEVAMRLGIGYAEKEL